MFACENGHIEIVRILLEQDGIDINLSDIDFFYSKFGFINLMFQKDIRNFFIYNTTPLICACRSGQLAVVRLLIEQEAIDINKKDVYLFFLIFFDFI